MGYNPQASVDQIERVSSKRKVDWSNALDSQSETTSSTKKARSEPVDTLEVRPKEASVAVQEQKEISSPSFWSKVWTGLWSIFGQSKNPNTGSSSKSGGDGVQGIGGSPNLEIPITGDLAEFIKCLKEAREALNQIQETNNEADSTEAEDERAHNDRTIKRLIQYLEEQRKIYGDGAVVAKLKLIFNHKRHSELRKEYSDHKSKAAEYAANDRTWGTLRKGAMVVTVAVTVTAVALSVIPTAGVSLAALPAMIGPALSVLQPVAMGASGVTNVMKGITSQRLGEQAGKLTVASHKVDNLSRYKMPADQKALSGAASNSLRIVTQYMKQVEEGRKQTLRSINSRG